MNHLKLHVSISMRGAVYITGRLASHFIKSPVDEIAIPPLFRAGMH